MARTPDVMKRVALGNLNSLLDMVIDGMPQAMLTPELLASQAKTYGASFPTLQIRGMAINTAKAVADRWLDGGFSELERKRLAALKALTENATPAKPLTRRETQDARIRELEASNSALNEDLAHLSSALKFALDCMRRYASQISDSYMQAQFRENERELFARAGMLREPPLPSATLLHVVAGGERDV